MKRTTILIAGGALAMALAGAGAGVAVAAGGDDDAPLTGQTLERASAAATQATGGGTVIETEAGDDDAAYGVEVRLPDGWVVEVNLDDTFAVLGQEADDDGADEAGPDD